MKMRRFVAPTLKAALAEVKATLGPDAVILSSRQENGQYEVVAAMDDVEAPVSLERPAAPRAPANSAELERLSSELQYMRQLLEQQMAGLAWGQAEQQAPQRVFLLKKLLNMGIGWELAQSLLQQVEPITDEDAAWSQLLGLVAQGLKPSERDISRQGGIVALVGPTGVGKTTTIAKLAGRFVMRQGASQLALVTTDCYKIGAQAQLQTFADLMGVPVHVARDQSELVTLLMGLRGKKLVLIDTAGMSQRDIRIAQQATNRQGGGLPVRNLLVLSAATPLKVMREVVEAFGQLKLDGLLFTKLDEATQLGSALTLATETGLPLTYFSEGQRVPEDLQVADPQELIDRAIVLGAQQTDERADMAFKLGLGKEYFDAH
ncbi:flagellar biosynthesis protein FlhF [Sulfurivirga caldicuralii]|uniref:Flagellar biosynthesis protein FlhF n=1 Tax=Sulfurivirga caldicuralii TaxID=364032 RepID=A0A1N6FKU3_9GAMM|nr:flagellar biosynthesis protein FlhF [Sulfurivirga caldicuralii]SIN95888.1 flagellar biosynthesis protein FlhF [Sulfurivirga caldicuralii]